MDGFSIRAKVQRGYAIAARALGTPYRQYRPRPGLTALDASGIVGTLKASFDANDYKYTQPNRYGKPVWTGLWNPIGTQPGDYLTDGDTTFFIASQQPLLPMQAVQCNGVLTLRRQAEGSASAPEPDHGYVSGYGGDIAANESLVLLDYPASVIKGARGEKSSTDLPSDPKTDAGMSILLPPLPGTAKVILGDLLTESDGTRYLVTAVERTDMGWRLNAVQTTV